jgi:DNA-binding response OmpR family regulator
MAVNLVLLVDHDENRLSALQRTITESGRAVLAASTASEGLALNLLFRPDMVIVEAGLQYGQRVLEHLTGEAVQPKVRRILKEASDDRPPRYFLLALTEPGKPATLLKAGFRWPKTIRPELVRALASKPRRKRVKAGVAVDQPAPRSDRALSHSKPAWSYHTD